MIPTAHYDDSKFDEDRGALLDSLSSAGITLVVNASSDIASSRASLALSEKYPFVYAAVGVHPHEASTLTDEALETLRELCAHNKVVAVGEIGLDYYYDFSPREVQREGLRRQMQLAGELKLPVVIHDRDAHEDCMTVAARLPGSHRCFPLLFRQSRKWPASLLSAVGISHLTVRSRSKTPGKRRRFWPGCRKTAICWRQTARIWLPVPVRGRRCDSTFLPYTAARIAEIRGETAEHVAEQTMTNGKRFFRNV